MVGIGECGLDLDVVVLFVDVWFDCGELCGEVVFGLGVGLYLDFVVGL